MLQEKIQKDLELAITNKDATTKNLLKVVISELSRGKEKDVSDEEVLKVIRKMKESAILCGNVNEVPILEKYLPKMMNVDDIQMIVYDIIGENKLSTLKDLSKVMSELKKDPNSNLIDFKIASSIAKDYLK